MCFNFSHGQALVEVINYFNWQTLAYIYTNDNNQQICYQVYQDFQVSVVAIIANTYRSYLQTSIANSNDSNLTVAYSVQLNSTPSKADMTLFLNMARQRARSSHVFICNYIFYSLKYRF
jgi:hypothetical protein